MLSQELDSSRIFLREIIHEDWRALHDCMLSSMLEFSHAEPPHEVPLSQLYVEQALFEQKRTPRRKYEFAIILKNTQKLIGACSLKIGHGVVREADIGYILNKNYWQQGYATEAAKCLSKFAFQELQIFRLLASCAANNSASISILKKLGMAQVHANSEKMYYALVRPITNHIASHE